MEIQPAFLLKKEVLFVAPKTCHVSIENPKEYLESGNVVGVDEETGIALICFLYHGYKSATEGIPFSHVISVYDVENGTHLEIGVFSGTAHDLRGKAPFGTHPIPEN